MSVIESTDNDNITFNLASDLVKNTNISLFLTGKAGTGKTTFLKHIQNTCNIHNNTNNNTDNNNNNKWKDQ
jgi:tRNA A37 threonylcarbamoyladenosine biosynthesis protein TsaE